LRIHYIDGEGLEGLAAQIEILRRAVLALKISLEDDA
jgi:hypothetical protein